MRSNCPSMLFWDVDTQADFIYPHGKLHVPGAESIIPNLKRLTEWARDHKVTIFASACAHHEDDSEFQVYPPHCLVGSPGQRKILETLLPNRFVLPPQLIVLPQDLWDNQQLIFEKRELNVFSNPNLDPLLKQIRAGTEIFLYGVVTEICVAITARGLLSRGFKVRLVTDAIAHLDLAAATRFRNEIRRGGGKLIDVRELLGRLDRGIAA